MTGRTRRWPEAAEFWEITINDRLRSRTTAHTGSVLGVRLTTDDARDGVRVSIQAVSTSGDILATTS